MTTILTILILIVFWTFVSIGPFYAGKEILQDESGVPKFVIWLVGALCSVLAGGLLLLASYISVYLFSVINGYLGG